MKQLRISKQITLRESQSLERYLQEIGKIDLITAEVEVDLARRIREGDQIAVEKLTKANLRFVVSVAKQYQNTGLTLGDLINEGNLGLIRAAKKFDEKRGFKFISYAVWWIRQAIMQSLAEESRLVRLPSNRVASLTKMSKVFSDLEQKFEREPSAEELAEVIGVSVDEVVANQSISDRHVSIDTPFSQESDSNRLLDVLGDANESTPDAGLMAASLKEEIDRALAALSEKESEVLGLYFGLNSDKTLSLEEIGSKLDLTRERVRQIKEKATHKLRRASRSSVLRSYLG